MTVIWRSEYDSEVSEDPVDPEELTMALDVFAKGARCRAATAEDQEEAMPALYGRQERMRELDGEEAYEKMKRAVERASQPPPPSQVPARKGPECSGPKRGGPERDYGPSR